jgi:mannose-6-phosphate isomerase-like protein (cupin superfamily)
MAEYIVKQLEELPDVMGDYPGEMRMASPVLDNQHIAFTHRRMPPDTGGKGSYGHHHTEQEEVYFVVSGTLTFKLGDDLLEGRPGTLVVVPPAVVRSVHNEGSEDVHVIIVSNRVEDPQADVVTVPDFWPG